MPRPPFPRRVSSRPVAAIVSGIALLGAAVLSGCASAPAASREEWRPNRRVAVVVAPFWSDFPPYAEGLGVIPARTLARGTPLRQLRNRFGFSEVQLETLERGWIPRGLVER